jgi:ribosomal protein S18 acetylase RimI-like enzyme
MNLAPTIRFLGPADAAVLANVAPEVFDNEVDPGWTAEFLADPRHHIAVALAEEQVIGMATAVHYLHPDKAPELWINEVGVAPSFRNQGIGKQLIAMLLSRGRSLGCTEAWLGTEESNTAARRLYAAAGGVEEPMVYVTFELDDKT